MKNKLPKRWYIRYNNEITREIYEKLIDHLFKLDYVFTNHCSMPLSYSNFQRCKYIRYHFENDSGLGFSIDNNEQYSFKLEEIQIDDILNIYIPENYDIY